MFGLGRMPVSKVLGQITEVEIDLKEYNPQAASKRIDTLLKGLLDYRTLAAEEFSSKPELANAAALVLDSLKGILGQLPTFSSLIKKHGEHTEPVDTFRQALIEQVEQVRIICEGFFHNLGEEKRSKR